MKSLKLSVQDLPNSETIQVTTQINDNFARQSKGTSAIMTQNVRVKG